MKVSQADNGTGGRPLKDPLVPKEVARELRVHPETVKRWIRSGKLPATKTPGGRDWRVWRKDLERYTGEYGRGAPRGNDNCVKAAKE